METSISPRLSMHLISPEPLNGLMVQDPMALPLQPDWQRLLRDTTTFGLVRIEVGNPWALISCIAEPWYAANEGRASGLRGLGVLVGGLTDHWATASISNARSGMPFHQLTISDHAARELLKVILTEDSAWTGFPALLVRQWARRGSPGSVPGTAATTSDDLEALQRCCGDWFDGTLQQLWHGRCERQRPGMAVDPSLVAPFLETMVDQVCPLRVILGNQGVIQRHDNSYFDIHQSHDRLKLLSSTATFSLDIGGIANARVVRPAGEGAGASRIHLYGEDGRCVVTLGLASEVNSGNRDLWQSMIRALAD